MPAGMPRNRGRLQARDGSRLQKLIDGEITFADLDDDEIAQGRLRASDGTFRGRPPDLIPRQLYTELLRELRTRGQRMFQQNLFQAIDTLSEIAEGAEKDSDAIAAAKEIITRVLGKVPDKVEITDSRSAFEEGLEEAALQGFQFGNFEAQAVGGNNGNGNGSRADTHR